MKIFKIHIIILILYVVIVQANNEYNHHHHHYHHMHQQQHNHQHQQQNSKNYQNSKFSDISESNNNNKILWLSNDKNPSTPINMNLDRRKITIYNNTASNKNQFNNNKPLKLNSTLNNNNLRKSILLKRNPLTIIVNNNINRTLGSNFIEPHNYENITNIKINDKQRLNSKSLTSLESESYKNYNIVTNDKQQQDNKDNMIFHDVEIIKRNSWNYDDQSKVSTTLTTTTTEPSTITIKGKSSNKVNEGRHICEKHKTVQIPVKTREIYSRPTWKQINEPCEDNQICTRVQLVHEPVYRDIIRHKSTRQVTYECCPGWEPTTKNGNSCMKPVCKIKCKNGGTCIKPDTCNCPQGFTGKYCEQDINECKTEKPCDQLCFNTEGSYYCECKEGFVLMSDKQSCKKINSQDIDDAFEARDLENDVENTDLLNNRIEKLEKMIANERITTNEILKNYQATSHLVDSLKTRLSTLEKQQQDISHLQDKLLSNDAKTKSLEFLVNILLKCQKNPLSCQQM